MNEKRDSKKRKCNDEKEKKLSLEVQAIKHQYTIEVLNYHCLGEIFSYLGTVDRLNLEKLCEKMRAASNFAWRRIKNLELLRANRKQIYIKQHSMKVSQTQSITKQMLVRCGNYLESLHLDICGNLLMSTVVNKCHNLQKLTIGRQSFDSKSFKNAFSNMKNLKYIEIKLSEDNDAGILESLPEVIEEISVKSLVSFIRYPLEDPPLTFSKDFENYSKNWKALRSLTLEQFIIDKGSNIIFNENYPLTHLNLVRCKFTDIHQTVSRLSNYRNLKHLNLMESSAVNDDLIHVIANNFENLEHLNIDGHHSISRETLQELGKLRYLREIFLNYISSVDDTVLGKFKNLKVLSCNWTRVGDTGVKGILDNSPNLEYLSIHHTRINGNKTLPHAVAVTNCREQKLVLVANSGHVYNFRESGEVSLFLEVKGPS